MKTAKEMTPTEREQALRKIKGEQTIGEALAASLDAKPAREMSTLEQALWLAAHKRRFE